MDEELYKKLLAQTKTKLRHLEKAQTRSFQRALPLKVPYSVLAWEGHIDGLPPSNMALQTFCRHYGDGLSATIDGWVYQAKDVAYSPLSNLNLQITVESLRKGDYIVYAYNEHPKHLQGEVRLILFADSRKPLYELCEDWGLTAPFNQDRELRPRR